jgi:DNA-binding transcriptional ArsR family regulator
MHLISDANHAAAVLHPLRLRILAGLAEQDSATSLARKLQLPRQLVNYHVRQLERAGLVEVVGERRRRNCTERLVRAVARSYLIDPSTLGNLAADPDRVEDHASSAYLVAAAARLIRELAVLRDGAGRTGKRVPTLTLQSEIRFATPESQQAFAAELTRTLALLVAKYHDDEAGDGRRFRLLVGAWPAPPPESASAATPEGSS